MCLDEPLNDAWPSRPATFEELRRQRLKSRIGRVSQPHHALFRTFGPDGNGLRIMDVATRQVTTLTREYDNFPLWSPRGDLITFSRQADGAFEIYTLRPDGTKLTRLTFTRGNDAHMAWSPDGEFMVFVSSRLGFKDEARGRVRHARRRHGRAPINRQSVGRGNTGLAAEGHGSSRRTVIGARTRQRSRPHWRIEVGDQA